MKLAAKPAQQTMRLMAGIWVLRVILVSGAWVGGDERSIHYREWSLGQGGKTARPIWAKYMLKVYADKTLDYKKGQFRRPSAGMDMTMDCKAYETPEDSDGQQPENWDPNL